MRPSNYTPLSVRQNAEKSAEHTRNNGHGKSRSLAGELEKWLEAKVLTAMPLARIFTVFVVRKQQMGHEAAMKNKNRKHVSTKKLGSAEKTVDTSWSKRTGASARKLERIGAGPSGPKLTGAYWSRRERTEADWSESERTRTYSSRRPFSKPLRTLVQR